ncbi:S-adenosyl-L-methionine-dependent methyltransferase [Sporodiniella umbellata]|nr:S-adenosyl-L-methionine-dependent methyltransferase [Sporodiniella umbellata]
MGNRVSASTNRRKRSKDRTSEKTGSEVQSSSLLSSETGSCQVSATATYWLPNHHDELDRLSSQHFALKILFDGNVSASILNTLDMDNAMVLDVGCGPGTWLMDMATEYPSGQFHGIDLYNIFPLDIRPANVNFKCHDATEGLPFPDNTFDLVNMRMLFIALKQHEWPLVYKEIHRVLKPGGYIQACECNTLETGNEFIMNVGRGFRQNMTDRDQDPYVGRNLDGILESLDYNILDFVRKEIVFSKPDDPLAKEFIWNIVKIMKNTQPLLEESMGCNSEQYEIFLSNFEQELQKKPDATWSYFRCVGQKTTQK